MFVEDVVNGRSLSADKSEINEGIQHHLWRTNSNRAPAHVMPQSSLQDGTADGVLSNAGDNLIKMKMSNNNLKV